MARPTVRILSRYILRQHIPPLLYALAALTFAMLVNQVAKQFGNFVGKGLPWGIIFEVFALSIPFIVAMTLPMAVLVAVLYTFSHLAADNEVTAMKASGISVGRVLAPVLGGATLIAVVALIWNDQILPRSNHTLRTLLVDIQRKKPTFQLKEQVINEVVAGQFFLRAARIDPAANTLSEMTICAMQDVVGRARQDEQRVRVEALAAVSAELRQVARLAPLSAAVPAADTTSPPPTTYCAVLGTIARLVGPRTAQAAQATPGGGGGGGGGGGRRLPPSAGTNRRYTA